MFARRYNQLPSYNLGTFAEALLAERRAGKDVIDLGQLNPDLPPPSSAMEKLVQAALLPHNHRYSASAGISRLRTAFAKRYQTRAVTLDPETEIAVVNGSKEGLVQLLSVLLDEQDEVFLPTPAYPLHLSAAALTCAKLSEFPLELNSFFGPLEERLLKSQARNKVVLCSFPHNPTTTTVDKNFFEKLVALAKKYNALIVHDAAYLELGFDEYRPPSILEIPGAKDCAVEFYTLSKAFAVPGWRVAAAVGEPTRIKALKRLKSHIDFGVFQPLQIAAAGLLENAEEILTEHRSIYRARRDTLLSGLKNIGWEIPAPKAGLFVWAEIPKQLGMDAEQFALTLLKECAVAVCPGTGFSSLETSAVRFALGEEESRIRQAVSRIGTVLRDTGLRDHA